MSASRSNPPPQRTRHPMQLCAHLVYSPTRRGVFRLNAAESVCCESSRAIGRLSFVDRTMVGGPCACNSCLSVSESTILLFFWVLSPRMDKVQRSGLHQTFHGTGPSAINNQDSSKWINASAFFSSNGPSGAMVGVSTTAPEVNDPCSMQGHLG